jgi:hypothetical protein
VDLGASKARDHFAIIERKDTFYFIILSVAVIAAVINIYIIDKRWEPEWQPTKSPSFFKILKEYFKNKNLFTLSRGVFLWNLGVGISSPFFSVHMLTYLNMTFVQIWIYTLIALTLGFGFNFIWGHMMDKVGTRVLIIANSIIITAIPLLWLCATPKNLIPIYVDAAFTGICWTGYNLAMFNMPLVLTPEKDKAFFLGIFITIGGISFGLGSILGGIIAYKLRTLVLTILGGVFINYHILFAVSTFLRGAGAWQFFRIKDTKGKGLVYLFQEIGVGLQKGYFIMRDFVLAPKKNA